MGIAEAGKLRAVAGDHTEALRHYREALKMARSTGAPEVFFRHYTQCVLESLEHTGSYGEVMEFCEKALRHFDSIEKPLDLHRRDQAATLERLAINLIKAGRADEAREPLEKAVALAGRNDVPVARTVLDWMQRGMALKTERICEVQAKRGYFTVTVTSVEPERAMPLPTTTPPRAGMKL
jgi:tetratricopeptide (TPR) repeat protein